MQLVVAEKPSVARDIAEVLGATEQKKGFLQGNGYTVTWALGHLVTLPQPHEVNPTWKRWSHATLPMFPSRWPLVVIESTKAQFAIVGRLLGQKSISTVICATDAGREGELIFRLISAHAKCRKPVKRLWISSLTPMAIRRGFASLQDAGNFDALAQAALGRSQADWLVGMNLTRAYSLGGQDTLSVGRVQTPTLAMVVQRDAEIRDFVPEHYLELWAKACAASGQPAGKLETLHMNTPPPRSRPNKGPASQPTRFAKEGSTAKAALQRIRGARWQVAHVDVKPKTQPPPRLYDLTELQRHAHRALGFSAQRTLDVAQQLYEKYKAISYPRTNCRHLSRDVAAQLPPLIKLLVERYGEALPPEQRRQLLETGRHQALGRRYVDDTRLTDHHAIIPTSTQSSLPRLPPSSDATRLYDLIAKRLLAAYLPDYKWTETDLWLQAESQPTATSSGGLDHFRGRGRVVQQLGYRVLDSKRKATPSEPPQLPDLQVGAELKLLESGTTAKQTSPPAHFNDASLLTAMETAGKGVDDQELSDALREQGLGTPATRAAIVEGLIQREYLIREAKHLLSTPKAAHLIDIVHPQVRSAAMTGEWELKLGQIEQGQRTLSSFLVEIKKYVREVVGLAKSQPRPPALLENCPAPSSVEQGHSVGKPAPRVAPPDATAGLFSSLPPRPEFSPGTQNLSNTLKGVFGHSQFRKNQQDLCQRIAQGQSHLVVMPTGAGKSLCYQLPGLARGGTTLVISPLIALMDDQVDKLQRGGLRAERLHSGRDRLHARAVCRAYLDGQLDFLFIAPERLGITGFPEMLSKRRLGLVAIDEAHCISQWGHDFRPDYRLLRERLPLAEDTPVVALTATATGQVQQDIVEQLGVASVRRAVHGFRRTNLEIEVAEVPVQQRAHVCERLLQDPKRTPAIVYSPTRKMATEVADHLSRTGRARGLRVASYHAGMPPDERERIQTGFLAGELDAIVATVAFGMGVDKANVRSVVHLALPGSVEGYYQEIGRAGRDGIPSLALLLCAQADRRTHDFFLSRDYPPPERLDEVYEVLSKRPRKRGGLARATGLKKGQVEVYLDKLLAHGGAALVGDDQVVQGPSTWQQPYLRQLAHRRAQIDHVLQYVRGTDCRMRQLIQHFGDSTDNGEPCGHCDRCSPRDSAGTGTTPSTRFCLTQSIQSARSQPDTSGTGRAKKKAKGRRGKRRGSRSLRAAASQAQLEQSAAPTALIDALRAWRLDESKRRKVPAYRIFSNRLLVALAETHPTSPSSLQAVPGIGATFVKRHGADVLEVLRRL